MNYKKLLFVAFPLLSICLSSCGEGKRVREYLMENGSHLDTSEEYTIVDYYDAYGMPYIVSFGYIKSSNKYRLFSSHSYVVTNDSLTQKWTVYTTIVFKWNRYSNSDPEVEFFCEGSDGITDYARVKFVHLELGICPSLTASMGTVHDKTFSLFSGVTNKELKTAAKSAISITTECAQYTLNDLFDREISLWKNK